MAETTKNKNKTYKPSTSKGSNKGANIEPLDDGNTLLEGFNPTQVAALVRVKQAVARGEYSDLTPEYKKWLFAKWLVEHERISG